MTEKKQKTALIRILADMLSKKNKELKLYKLTALILCVALVVTLSITVPVITVKESDTHTSISNTAVEQQVTYDRPRIDEEKAKRYTGY